jgi:hypothetical protein
MLLFRYVELDSLYDNLDSSTESWLLINERRASVKEGKRKGMGYFLFFRNILLETNGELYISCSLRFCLVHPKNQNFFKILCHIESCGTCMKH